MDENYAPFKTVTKMSYVLRALFRIYCESQIVTRGGWIVCMLYTVGTVESFHHIFLLFHGGFQKMDK